jgi:hypothetical protein
MVSVTKIRLDRRKSTRLFKRIICDDTRSRSLANAREALSRPTAVSSSDGSIDLSHLEALPGPSCVSTALQLKRERSLRARFAEANGNYHNISNTWLVRGFPSSSPLTPARQYGLCGSCKRRPAARLIWVITGSPWRAPSWSNTARCRSRMSTTCSAQTSCVFVTRLHATGKEQSQAQNKQARRRVEPRADPRGISRSCKFV